MPSSKLLERVYVCDRSCVDPLTLFSRGCAVGAPWCHSRFSFFYVGRSHRLSSRFQCEICADVVDVTSDNTASSTVATKSVVLASGIRSSAPKKSA